MFSETRHSSRASNTTARGIVFSLRHRQLPHQPAAERGHVSEQVDRLGIAAGDKRHLARSHHANVPPRVPTKRIVGYFELARQLGVFLAAQQSRIDFRPPNVQANTALSPGSS
jgi:hypothetical protein